MVRRLAVLVATLVSAFAAPAKADEAPAIQTISDLYQICKSEDVGQRQRCLAYLQGSNDLTRAIGDYANSQHDLKEQEALWLFSSCGSPTPEQLRDAFVAWAGTLHGFQTHPASEGAMLMVLRTKEWMCPWPDHSLPKPPH
jgi:hypothetical protein